MELKQLKYTFPLYLDQTIEVSGRFVKAYDTQYLIDDEGYVLPLVFTETLTEEFAPNVYTNFREQNLVAFQLEELARIDEDLIREMIKRDYISPNVQVAGRLQKSGGYFLDDILYIRNLEMLINPRFEGIIKKHTVDLETYHHHVPPQAFSKFPNLKIPFFYGMMSYHRLSTDVEEVHVPDIRRQRNGYLPSIQATIGKRIETHAKLLNYDAEHFNHIVEIIFSNGERITVTLSLGKFGENIDYLLGFYWNYGPKSISNLIVEGRLIANNDEYHLEDIEHITFCFDSERWRWSL